MTEEEQRIAIGESCGAYWGSPVMQHDTKWHVHFAFEPFEFDSKWAGPPPSNLDDCIRHIDVPDYLRSLDAMYDAERSQWDNVLFRQLFRSYLVSIVTGRVGEMFTPTHDDWEKTIHSTPAQRAEAFLRSMGLWKD